MRLDRLPLTYDESRARFRRAAEEADLPVRADAIEARGPEGQRLTVDSVWLGPTAPRRALTVQSGVHGVEGFACSALQTDLLGRLDPTTLPDDVGVLVIHAVNPWGMAWGRRQNESNVDLNRNWRRDDFQPQHNDAYDEIHHLACPDTATMPSVDELLAEVATVVSERGLPWLRDAITVGQYRHPDGLHYGGARTEASCRIVEAIVAEHLVGVDASLAIDLHTGHGPRGTLTLLSDQPPGSPQDKFLHEVAGDVAVVEATADNPEATTGVKSGQIANGIGQLLGDAEHHATSAELGTAGDTEQLVATYLEHWVHHHGDRSRPEHAAVTWRYRCCFTPDDPEWEAMVLASGRKLLDQAVAAVTAWDA